MSSVEMARTMARYNRWQNRSLYGAADTLSEEERKRERGAFFGSIHGTLSHLLFGDQIWLSRFAGTPLPRARSIPESVKAYASWDELQADRMRFDTVIVEWADRLDEAALDGTMTWKPPALDHEVTRPRRLLLAHIFNHQTHHRGQVHCMLTQAGAKPDDTDLWLLDA